MLSFYLLNCGKRELFPLLKTAAVISFEIAVDNHFARLMHGNHVKHAHCFLLLLESCSLCLMIFNWINSHCVDLHLLFLPADLILPLP